MLDAPHATAVSLPIAPVDPPFSVPRSAFNVSPLTYSKFNACIHCGLCLPACPTYLATSDEADSPRGRIYLMKAAADLRLPPSPIMLTHLDRCLVCRACEPACPSGVDFHALLESVRPHIAAAVRGRPLASPFLQWLIAHIFPFPRRTAAAILPLRLADKIGLGRLLRRLAAHLPEPLPSLTASLPPNPAAPLFPKPLPAFTVGSAFQPINEGGAAPSGADALVGKSFAAPPFGSPAFRRSPASATPISSLKTQDSPRPPLSPQSTFLSPQDSRLKTHPSSVLLLQACLGSLLSPALNRACLKVLTRNGFDVCTLSDEPCCGAMAAHANDPASARDFAAAMVDRLSALPHIDFFISPIAGCGAQLKSLAHLLAPPATSAPPSTQLPMTNDQLPITNYQLPSSATTATHHTQSSVLSPQPSSFSTNAPAAALHARALAVTKKIRDITELLASIDLVPPTIPLRAIVAYHDPCHLLNVQRIADAPRRLLAQIPGITLVPLPESDICCGAAGTYNLAEPTLSADLGTRKCHNILSTGATIVATANIGCQLQIQRHLARAGHPNLPVQHVLELLAKSYED